jgi:cell wall-associated NlpC family hydrolase
VAASTLALTAFIVPGASAAPKPTVQQVQRSIDRLQQEAERASEQYNETKERLASITVRLAAGKDKLARQKVEVTKAKVQVGRLAAETYRRGQMSALDIVLGDDEDAYLAQAGYLPSLAERQNGAMNRLSEGQKTLAATEKDIAAQRKRAEIANTRIKLTRKTVQQKLAQEQDLLSSLQASQRAQLRRAQNSVESAGVPSGGGASMCLSMAAQASSQGARTALRFACNQLGDPYVWAADGPGSYDCSGLTMRAWQAAGVSLPHSSQLQAGYGRSVSVSALQPGDLVFFNSPISHVGIYLGKGLMVHAPHTGDVVRVAAIYQTPSAAVRL